MQIPTACDKTGSANIFGIDRKITLLKKAIALAVLAVLLLVAFLVVRHYFYVLDSYYYSAEFHVNLIKNNLRNANVELFIEYFKSLGTVAKISPMLLFAYFIQNFWVLFSKPILVAAIKPVLGLTQSAVLNYISLLFTGLTSFWIGIFFLGDAVPLLFKEKGCQDVSASRKYVTYGIVGALFSMPIMPVIIPACFSALIRIRIKPLLMIMTVGFIMRLVLLISFPIVFI